MSLAERLAAAVSALALRQLLEAAAALLSAILLVRYFGPEGYGALALVLACAEVAALATGSFEEAVRRFVPELLARGATGAARRVLAIAVLFRVALGILVAALLALAAPRIAGMFDAAAVLGAPLRAGAWLVVPIGAAAVATSLLIALERYRLLTIAAAASAAGALLLALLAPALQLELTDYFTFTVAFQLVLWLAMLLAGWRALAVAPGVAGAATIGMPRLWAYVWPLWGSAISYTAYQHVSRMLLAAFAPLAVVGWFAVAKNVVERLTGLYYQLPASLLPALSARLGEGADAANAAVVRLARWITPVALLLSLLVLCLAPELVLIFGGAAFAPAASVLAIFAIQFVFRLQASLWGTLYYLHERTRTLLWMNLARVVPLIALLLLLVPRSGAHGAAAAEAASYAISLALFAVHVPRTFGVPAVSVIGRLPRALLLFGGAAALVWLSGGAAPVRYALAAAAPVLVLAAGFVGPAELGELRALPLSGRALRGLRAVAAWTLERALVRQREAR